ncbi:putative Serine-threonin protein phosphatase [Leptomonas pyrrhocoris]|uniref:Putative Serine-threonin protein phosphatase n=1 Tax=Leptomonas pyrrhocoris TaxID=157538 RepID=A0A0N0VHG5_LEPPY|nr:putative Serine-threonin protein phosphatase [Leptomonas pyrrhocoris]KPA85804.1 putative Serine-threonin protein phosphatase [Leptomonas pyrrhocoris]|eukprot:XP_015664243.1 putative Serine-threonin protein phosphatase [Leptomonas pyrrhocoris]
MRRCAVNYYFTFFALVTSICSVLVATPAAATKELVEIHRIVTVGDVHGDAENFLKVLRLADVVEEGTGGVVDVLTNPPQWKFSQAPNASVTSWTTLVQMGDLVDRGEQDFESLNIAMALQEQTQNSLTSDRVILLIGNHELLNIQGHYHYVNKRNYGGFISRPLRMEAMNADGAFGKYIIDNFRTAYLDENTLFVHAGIEADMLLPDLNSLNSEVREALRKRDFRHAYLRSNGPLWTRKMISDSMMGDCDEVNKILQRFNVSRIVVGHTPQDSGQIEQYCNKRVIAADVGMSRWMYNNVAALEMVFFKYLDTDLQQISTEFIIRELREGVSAFSMTSDGRNDGEQLSPKSSFIVDDDNGDL